LDIKTECPRAIDLFEISSLLLKMLTRRSCSGGISVEPVSWEAVVDEAEQAGNDWRTYPGLWSSSA
jgi:hypothetical protein